MNSHREPFRLVEDLTIEIVDSYVGSGKSLTAMEVAVNAARDGARKTICVFPTHELIGEMIANAKKVDPSVDIVEITSPNAGSVHAGRPQYKPNLGTIGTRVRDFIKRKSGSNRGLVLFITHEGFFQVSVWPEEADEFDIIIDEAPTVVLTREPFKLRYAHWNITSFLDTNPVPTTLVERNNQVKAPPEFTDFPDKRSDRSRLETYALICAEGSVSSDAEKAMAAREGSRLLRKREAWEAWLSRNPNDGNRDLAMSYYLLTAKPDDNLPADPYRWIRLRADGTQVDQIYKELAPIARWLLQGAALFTEMKPWNAMVLGFNKDDPEPVQNRGQITIIGFHRPDQLKVFKKVTVMAALLKHTMMYKVWEKLGVKFVPSSEIDINIPKLPLGNRRKLNIYWLYDQGWSKRTRDTTGGGDKVVGITKVLELIKSSKVIKPNAEVCVVVNNDIGSPENPGVIHKVFPKAIVMPHNSKGQNRFVVYHQLMHLAALNPYTPDIIWLEQVLGIDAEQQRIAITGQEVYQTMGRTSIRNPKSQTDVHIIVMDKSIAEWLAQWFEPDEQVFVHEIDSTGVIIRKKSLNGRPLLGEKPLSKTERQRRWRAKKKESVC